MFFFFLQITCFDHIKIDCPTTFQKKSKTSTTKIQNYLRLEIHHLLLNRLSVVHATITKKINKVVDIHLKIKMKTKEN